jgi:adenylate cyclase
VLKKAILFLDHSARWAVPSALLAALLMVRVFSPDLFEPIQFRAFDAFLNIAPRPYPEELKDTPVRVIDIDETSIAKIGQWPWSRTKVAELIRRLDALGVKSIALDMVFPEADRTSPALIVKDWPDDPAMKDVKARVVRLPDHDAVLARAYRDSGRVVAGFAPATTPTKRQVKPKVVYFGPDVAIPNLKQYAGVTDNLPSHDEAAAGLGCFGFSPEYDGVIRRVPLLFNVEGQVLPALSLEAVRVALGEQNPSFMLTNSVFGLASNPGVFLSGRKRIPTDENGRFWVRYTDAAPQRIVSAWDVLNPKGTPPDLKGAIVFVGTSATGLKDLRATPLNPSYDGVEVHANVAEQILSGSYLERSAGNADVEILLTGLFGLILIGLLLRLGAAWSGPVGLGMVLATVWLSWHAYIAWHRLVDPVYPSCVLAAVYFSFAGIGYVRSDRERRRITDTFGRYLSPKVVAELAKSQAKVELGGETREMTFHFCDIRGFTTISEGFDPHGLTEFINRFLTPMTQIVLDHDGTIDKYMGDCIMAFWNAPQKVQDHARKACAAALAMHAKLDELNARWQADAKAAGKSLPEIHIGTGLNTGPCVVGNMGSTLRVDYTVLGDDVNLASRLEGQSKSYGVRIVIGPVTREQAPEFAALELDLLKVKGKTKPVRIYALLGDSAAAASEPFRALARAHEAMLAGYRRQDWEEAERFLKEARKLGAPWSLDKLYALYEERVQAFRADPPGPGWDGVATALTK